jgi:chromate transporter
MDSPLTILRAFLRLGLTSFGGPVAHVAYFRREFVERRAWLSEEEYARLLALCQFLPGPASSQVGFSLGLLRGGWAGGLAAWTAFTLPSALLLLAVATLLPHVQGDLGAAAAHGLKVVALAVVAHGLLGMAPRLCPDAPRAAIAALAAAVLLNAGTAWAQLAVVAGGALAGGLFCRSVTAASGAVLTPRHGPRTGVLLLLLFGALLLGLPVAANLLGGSIAVVEAFYRAGALVFGGGHVVLPLLEETVVAPGWISQQEFLAGYGAAQAVPGPMFTLSAYLGALLPAAGGGATGALVALLSIFLPGMLLAAGALPLWHAVAERPAAARAVAGVNAAVVGLLGAALYDPVWTSAVRGPADLAIAVVAFAWLATGRSALAVVLWCVAATVAATLVT